MHFWKGIRNNRYLTVFFNHCRRFTQPPPRGSYSKINDRDLTFFERIVGGRNCVQSDLDQFNGDWLKTYKGASQCVLFPTSDSEVSAILQHCYSRNIAVVPQSGNTGLVGGSVPVYDELVLSFRKLNKYYSFDPCSGILACDAGLILEDVDNRLASEGFMVPWDLGSRGSCLIGGNISTSVGGVRRLRFGSLHNHIVGVEVALADEKGSLMKFGSKMKKDNTALHTHHLFIGSEGQLGAITRAYICVVPRPTSVHVLMIGTNSFQSCKEILSLAKKNLGEILSAVELMDSESMRCLNENMSITNVLTTNPEFNILIETMGSNESHDSEKISNFFNEINLKGYATDGAIAMDLREAQYMWKLRKTIPVAPLYDGFVFKHDLSLPLEHFLTLVDIMKERLGPLAKRVLTFGHFCDGDSHINITAEKYSVELEEKIYPFLCEWVVEHGGSISAEHGVGQERRPYRYLTKRNTMKISEGLKLFFDKRLILSPYKMI